MTSSILATAERAGRAAAASCRAVTASAVEAMAKGDKSPVTVADYASQAVILREVAADFPDHRVISEEGADHLRANSDKAGVAAILSAVAAAGVEADFDQVCSWIDHAGTDSAEFVWCVDPIDGTKGFLRGDQYAVAIGVLQGGVPVAGVLACPNLPVDLDQPDGPRGVLYIAAQGQGCRRVPLDGGETTLARASEADDPAQARVLGSVESSHGDPKLVTDMMAAAGIGGGFVRYDSQAKYGIVAQGAAELYVRPRNRPDYREKVWDHAGGAIVATESGAIVTDLDGKNLDFSHGNALEENRGVLVSSSARIHEAALAGLRAAETNPN